MTAFAARRALVAGTLATALAAVALLAGCAANDLPDGANANQALGSSSSEAAASRPAPSPSLQLGREEDRRASAEPGFVSTAHNPRSTLSADVDTASYCNLRRMVADGCDSLDIPAETVRTEELLNYFDYAYPAPDGDDLFGVSAQVGDCPWNDEAKLLVMGFATEAADRAPSEGSNLVFLVDTSGSMDEPNKLPLLKDAFATLVEGLGERDRVSVVTYASGERTVLEGASGADKQRILRAIDGLTASGATNGEAGLERAYLLAERSFIEGGVNRIVMASDGDLNVGISSEAELHDYVERKRETGVYLSVLGFGSGNYQDSKMETLADHGNGAYHYIDCIEEARRVFGENLRANLMPLADDVKVQVEFDPAQVAGYRLIGYENRALANEDFLDDGVDAGEVGAGHAFTVAYEIVPAGAVDGAWLAGSIRYRPAGSTQHVEQAFEVDGTGDAAQPSDDWTFAAAVIECGMTLSRSPFAGTSTLETAHALLLDAELTEQQRGFRTLLATLIDRGGSCPPFSPPSSR